MATVDAYEESIKGLSMNSAAAATQAGYSRLRAPFHGVVTRRWMEPGDLAVPGKPILTVEKVSPYKVTVQVPQEEMEGLKPGGKAHLGYGDRVTTAAISPAPIRRWGETSSGRWRWSCPHRRSAYPPEARWGSISRGRW